MKVLIAGVCGLLIGTAAENAFCNYRLSKSIQAKVTIGTAPFSSAETT